MELERAKSLCEKGFPVALPPAQMVALINEREQLLTELAMLRVIAANLATTGAMAVGALSIGSAVSGVLVEAVKRYNEYAYSPNGIQMSKINPDDVIVSTYPEPVTCGMITGKFHSGIKVLHKPTGLVAICEKHRHQHLNREEALKELALALGDPAKQV